MDFTAVQTMMTSLKAASDICKAIVDIKTTTEVQTKVIEIQRALLAAQSSALEATNAQFSLQERVRDLESQIKGFSSWSKEEDRYALVGPWRGSAQVYALKKNRAQGEGARYLCANCFHNRKRVILNPVSKAGWVYVVCPACRAEAETGFRAIGPPKFAEDIGAEGTA